MSLPLLERVSLLYLALPWFVFAVGWLRPPIAAVVVFVLVLNFALELRSARAERAQPRASMPKTALAVMLIALVWTVLSGAGGFGFQNLDWHKHNLMLSDLSEERWPVDFVVLQPDDSRTLPLTYYFAYYLPPAAIGRLLGWPAANDALFAFTAVGVLLGLLWFGALTRGHVVWSALLFVAFSGMDVIGRLFFNPDPYKPTAHLEWWAKLGSFQYSSNTSLLFWVPQHALVGWIATGLVVVSARNRRDATRALLVATLAALWSPFVVIGLVPFVLAALWTSSWRSRFSFSNLIAAPILAAVVLLFLASRGASVEQGWQFTQQQDVPRWTTLVAFYVLEVGAFAALVRPGSVRDDPWWWIAIASLLLLPLYRIGRFNDLTMRASIPALFVFWGFVAVSLQGSKRTLATALLAVLLCIGAVTPANELIRALAQYRWETPQVDPRPLLVQDPLYRSYLGDGRSWFFRHLARPLRQIVTIEAEHPRRADREVRTEPAEMASDGRVLVADESRSLVLSYGFDLEKPIHAAALVARHRNAGNATIDVAIDGSTRVRLSLPPTATEWHFATTRFRADLDAGRHELRLTIPPTQSTIDAFFLLEDPRG